MDSRHTRHDEPAVALRPYAAGDLALLRRLLGDPGMMAHLGGPEPPDAIADRHQRYLQADSGTNGLFTVTAGPGAEPVGWVGFWEAEWGGEAVWECGWHVLPEVQGRGVATSAVGQMIAEARGRRRHRWLHAFPSVDNAASNALCRTLGFTCRGEVEVEYPKGRGMRAHDWRLDLWPAHDPRVRATEGDWSEEAREDALARAPGFGRRLFAELAERHPAASASAYFLRWSVQPGDVYAVVDLAQGGFTVQVDPDLDYLVVWTAEEQAEFGDWAGDQVEPALAHIAGILAAADLDAAPESDGTGAAGGADPAAGPVPRLVERDGVVLAAESFGAAGDPAVLLIMGAMASSVWWPDGFCRRLAAAGRFVIRYDHRDTGGSTSGAPGAIDYTVEDLADDALRVLDGHGVARAHLVGMSLGGFLAQLVALKAPERVLTLTLIGSERLAAADPAIPAMSPEVLAYHAAAADLDWTDHEAVAEYQVGAWRVLHGPAHPFDEAGIRALVEADLARTPDPLTPMNHALLGDAEGWYGRLGEIGQPALVIHGTHDPVLPYAHAEALLRDLPHAELVTLEGAGHELHPDDWPAMLAAIVRHTGGGSGPASG